MEVVLTINNVRSGIRTSVSTNIAKWTTIIELQTNFITDLRPLLLLLCILNQWLPCTLTQKIIFINREINYIYNKKYKQHFLIYSDSVGVNIYCRRDAIFLKNIYHVPSNGSELNHMPRFITSIASSLLHFTQHVANLPYKNYYPSRKFQLSSRNIRKKSDATASRITQNFREGPQHLFTIKSITWIMRINMIHACNTWTSYTTAKS